MMSVPEVIAKTRDLNWNMLQTQDWLTLAASLKFRLDTALLPVLNHTRELAEPRIFAPARDQRSALPAVTWGRYQLVTTWHLDAVVHMLQHHPRVVIGVLDPAHQPDQSVQPPPEHAHFYRERNRASAPQLNPMTAHEVTAMWNAALIGADLHHRVTVIPIGRPELDPTAFNELFKEGEYDTMLPDGGADVEPTTSQHQHYSQILHRIIYSADSSIDLDGELRALFEEGNDAWKRHVPRGALEVFQIVNGEDRLLRSAPIEAIHFHAQPAPSGAAARIAAIVQDGLLPHTDPTTSTAGDHPRRRFIDAYYAFGTSNDFATTIEAVLPSAFDRPWTTDSTRSPQTDGPATPGPERGQDL
ncbi:hypothetical protein ACQP1G_20930 [Nocardia sp. CA-107356]|uniref:hypothetical protein n=1 Tax=Nocardia sp. CA-107356 TaxID=3239972 RepID=UPI003D92CADA